MSINNCACQVWITFKCSLFFPISNIDFYISLSAFYSDDLLSSNAELKIEKNQFLVWKIYQQMMRISTIIEKNDIRLTINHFRSECFEIILRNNPSLRFKLSITDWYDIHSAKLVWYRWLSFSIISHTKFFLKKKKRKLEIGSI